jgi:hypothetical protein
MNSSQNILVGIATGYGLQERGSQSSSHCRVKNCLFSTLSRPALGSIKPSIQWKLAVLSPGIKRQGREANHSLPASADIKKIWIYIYTFPYAFMA